MVRLSLKKQAAQRSAPEQCTEELEVLPLMLQSARWNAGMDTMLRCEIHQRCFGDYLGGRKIIPRLTGDHGVARGVVCFLLALVSVGAIEVIRAQLTSVEESFSVFRGIGRKLGEVPPATTDFPYPTGFWVPTAPHFE